MNLWDFLLTLGFWQWLGVIILAGIVGETIRGIGVALFSRGKP